MGIFDPKTDTSVAYEQPVEQAPSMGLALANVGANIASGIIEARADARGGSPDTSKAMAEFQNDIAKAEAARSSNPQKAERLEREALLKAQRGGLSYNTDLQATYSAMTGRPGDELLYSPEEIMENKLMETDAYRTEWLATLRKNPDASPEERHMMAIAGLGAKAQQDSILQNQSISWTTGKQNAYTNKLNGFVDAEIGALLQSAQTGQRVSLESINMAEAEWNRLKTIAFARPPGVEDSQWKSFETQLEAVDKSFTFLKEISGPDGIEAELAAEFTGALQDRVKRGDLSPGYALIGLNNLKDALAVGSVTAPQLKDILDSAITPEDFPPSTGQTTGYDEQGNPVVEILPKSVMDSLKAEDAAESFTRAKNLVKLTGANNTSKVSSDPAYRSDFFKTTQVAFVAMNKIGEDNRRFVTADGIAEVFNGSIVEGLRSAAQQDPVRARATANIAVEALDTQFSIASGQLSNTLAGSSLRLDPQGNIVLNREALLERIQPSVLDTIERIAEESYNGNIIELLRDNGQKALKFDPNTGAPAYGPEIMAALSTDVVKEGLGDYNAIRSQLRSVKAINNKRQEFISLRDEFTTEEVANETGAVVGTQVGDQAGLMLNLIDKTEGGANYDTLFQFSNQEGGAFAGTKVSEMTIGQLSDFSRGEYADWSKDQLGYVATPMGRYQIVGTTLRETAKEMGLSDDTRFTPAVQDAMFYHIANKALQGKGSPAAKRSALRGVWEGFKNVSDAELDKAIAEFEGTEPPSFSVVRGAGGPRATGAPSVTTETLPPATGTGSAASIEMTGATTQPTPVETEAPVQEQQETPTVFASSITQQVPELPNFAEEIGLNLDDTPYFESVEQAEEALRKGSVAKGQRILVNTGTDLKVMEVE